MRPSFWNSDRGLTALLVFLFVTLLVAPPLLAAGIVSPVLFDVLFSLILISGVTTVSTRKWPAIPVIALAVVAIGLRFAALAFPRPSLDLAESAVTFIALLAMAALVLVQVFRPGPMTVHRVQGSVAVYMLLGVAWAAA